MLKGWVWKGAGTVIMKSQLGLPSPKHRPSVPPENVSNVGINVQKAHSFTKYLWIAYEGPSALLKENR